MQTIKTYLKKSLMEINKKQMHIIEKTALGTKPKAFFVCKKLYVFMNLMLNKNIFENIIHF